MNRTLWLFIFVWLSFSPIAHAAKSSKHKKVAVPAEDAQTPSNEDASIKANKTPGDDVDEVITNKQMRAEAGSKSRWSISNSINWDGSTIEHPFAEERPNISGGTDTTNWAVMSDQVSGKYNIDQFHSVLAGFGARWITPFNSDHIPASSKGPYNGTKVDAYNPYLKYQYVYKKYGIQNVLSAGLTYITQEDSVRLGYLGNILIQQISAYEFGHSGFTLGMLGYIIGTGYNNRDYLAGTSDYSFAIEPFLEYVITDRINIRTTTGLWSYEHLRTEPRWATFYKDGIYESFGFGISVTRDVFLYPNVQILPEHIRADLTNVALSANINLF